MECKTLKKEGFKTRLETCIRSAGVSANWHDLSRPRDGQATLIVGISACVGELINTHKTALDQHADTARKNSNKNNFLKTSQCGKIRNEGKKSAEIIIVIVIMVIIIGMQAVYYYATVIF